MIRTYLNAIKYNVTICIYLNAIKYYDVKRGTNPMNDVQCSSSCKAVTCLLVFSGRSRGGSGGSLERPLELSYFIFMENFRKNEAKL